MGVFNKWGGPQKTESDQWPIHDPGTPASGMAEMEDYSNYSSSRYSTPSRQSTEKVRSSLHSSAASVISHESSVSVSTSYMSRKAEKGWVHDINKHQLMAKHLYRNCRKNNWVEGKTNA